MSFTGITSLDHAPQVAAEWLNELSDDLFWSDKGRAYVLLRATLHALRDFMTADEAADLAAQLPVLMRGIYCEGWRPSATPVKRRSKADLLERVSAAFAGDPPDDVENCIGAVFDLLQRRISKGEIEHVRHSLRRPIQEIWA
ncbi:DUF2267 domain-containing protein [Albimonas pacifica]|uniref:Uncharacterized conserved protein, DUF2267 family n=1 Tax=Albimonas pacifica TaxID=1114924 RepID=A0A1I3IYQ3_9RHOB|nr:DUF2267 domain-containing protein [Albimonas pacifica]SFI53030.1 Uncharacterized conserved protein, DUF2267 family [Albimonas pacifica]